MAKRRVIKIDREKCTGCGQCIPNCPEGALQVIDGKARLVSDLFCDGLGACIGHCPEGAINIEERDAEAYDESKVMENVVRQGKNLIKAHLEHLKEHRQDGYLRQAIDFLKQIAIEAPREEASAATIEHRHEPSGCPGMRVVDFRKNKGAAQEDRTVVKAESQLENWPVQITLVPVNAPYLAGADLLVAADCVAFAYADFHQDLLKGKILLIGCPKLDDARAYQEKITQMFKANDIKSITCAHMEVPCCFGLVNIVKSAISASGKQIEYKEVTIGIRDPSQLKITAGCSG